MGINLSQLDLSNVEARGALDPIPAGWQIAVITDTAMKPTTSGEGQYMEVTSEIIDGPYKGRKLYDRLNLVNANETAVKIAYETLKAIYTAVGKLRVNDSAELHGIPYKVKVKLRAARQEKDIAGQVIKEYEASNEVGAYDHISSAHAIGGASAGIGGSIAGGVAGSPAGVPAWAAGQAAAAPAATGAPGFAGQPAAAAPGASWTPPGGGQPWEQPGAGAAPGAPGAPFAAAAPPAAVQPVVQLTADGANGGLALQNYYDQKWTDDLLVAHGKAQWVTPAAPAPLAGPAAPGAPGAPLGGPVAATGAPGGATPPWAR